jgi:nicotinamide mononucleotide (NMN) deamidase PncC
MSGLKSLACRALELASAKGLSIVTAESCTAGKLSALLEAPGAAEHLHGYGPPGQARQLPENNSVMDQR